MRVHFSDDGWEDHLHWVAADTDIHRRLSALIEDARRHPRGGVGRPEALKGDLSDCWSRRITAEHRVVYRGQGRAGEDQRIEIIQCRYHY